MKTIILAFAALSLGSAASAGITIRPDYYGGSIIRDSSSGQTTHCRPDYYGGTICN